MRFKIRYLLAGLAIAVVAGAYAPSVWAEDLGGKTCNELLRLSRQCQDDLRTVDMVIGAAVDAGNMDTIRNYKMKRGAMLKERDQIMSAIKFKACVQPR